MADTLERVQKLVSQLTLPEIGTLIEDLERERDAKLAEARAALLHEVEERSAALGLTAAQLISGRQAGGRAEAKKPKSKRTSSEPAEVRYRDPESGGTWTGNGRIPRWVKDYEAAGRNRSEFLVSEA